MIGMLVILDSQSAIGSALSDEFKGNNIAGGTPSYEFKGSFAATQEANETSGPPALVQVDLRTPGDPATLQRAGVQIYAQLVAADGREYVLVQANATQQATLRHLGLSPRLLDADSRAATYYLVRPPAVGALGQARLNLQLLSWDGRQGVARANPGQAEDLLALGFQLQRLYPNPPPPIQARTQLLPTTINPEARVQTMLGQVSVEAVYYFDGSLSGEWPVTIDGAPFTLTTRYTRTTTEIKKATRYVYEHFLTLGLPATFHTYFLPGSTDEKRNVIAEQAGLTQPERIFLITAHLDSYSENPYYLAPGADDNASGSTAVLVTADVLSQYDFGCTLRYALFTGEEQGLYGSEAYARAVASQGENVEAVLNLDMVGYDSDGDRQLELHTRRGNAADLRIANLFAEVVSTYGLDLAPVIEQDALGFSDHASFWAKGYPALLAIEDWDDHTPCYHRTCDRVGILDLAYFAAFVRAAVGTAAHLGCLLPLDGALQGKVFDAQSQASLPGALVQAAMNAAQVYTTTSGIDGSYSLALPVGTYEVSVSLPWYADYSAPGITITGGQSTALDVGLQPLPRFTVSGTVRQAGSGAPLLAIISATASPVAPVQSDPATGAYSLNLPQGVHTLQVSAEDYFPQSRQITLEADLQQDFDLEAAIANYLALVMKE